jgi:hypothetical protein
MVSLLSDQALKPHLRLKYGIWSCESVCSVVGGCRIWRMGFGYTWRDAWADWERQRV